MRPFLWAQFLRASFFGGNLVRSLYGRAPFFWRKQLQS